MIRIAPVRVVLVAVVATILAIATLSATPSPARADGNEGSPVTIPYYKPGSGLITAGDHHTCAVIGAASTVWCWGGNSAGQLGNGSTVDSSAPVQVSGLSGVTQVSAGGNHTCALLTSGAARCWGGNGNGQLGDGTTMSSPVPVTPAGGHTFTSISASRVFTCGTTASQVRCWGFNSSGQLGTGDFVQKNFPVVANVPGTPKFVATGRNQACAVNTLKNLYCWGDNDFGQLGIGTSGTDQPTPQPVSSLTGVEAVSSGTSHTCAQSSAASGGGTYCWGYGLDSALGNGSTASSNLPVMVANPDPSGDRVLSTGTSHTCVTNHTRLRCWGLNSSGQLGTGTNTSSSFPVNVVGYGNPSPIVTTGASHTCAQKTGPSYTQPGSVDCWGSNANGQLGVSGPASSNTPVPALAIPGQPDDMSVLARGSALKVSWTPPLALGGLPVKNYRIRDLDGGFDVTVPGDTSSRLISGLTLGQTYRVVVSAINEIGEGQYLQHVPFTLPSHQYFVIEPASHAEGNSGTKAMSFVIDRYNPTAAAVTVAVRTSDGVSFPAKAPTDYTAKQSSLTFAVGQTTRTFTVSTRGDKLAEDDETFRVSLFEGGDFPTSTGIGTIVNDDPGGKPAYTIDSVNMVEGNAGTTNMVFTIGRTGSTAVAGSVKYNTVGLAGNATAGEDFVNKAPTSVSFPVGVTSKSVSIAIKGDLVAENNEYFQVVLSAPVNGDLPSLPWGYGQILNDDSNAPTTVSVGPDVTVVEGDGFSKSVTFTILRSGSLAGTTTLKWATQDGSATAPGDFTAKAPTNLSFAAGVASKTITVTVKGGTVAESEEEFHILLTDITGGAIVDGYGSIIITDDD